MDPLFGLIIILALCALVFGAPALVGILAIRLLRPRAEFIGWQTGALAAAWLFFLVYNWLLATSYDLVPMPRYLPTRDSFGAVQLCFGLFAPFLVYLTISHFLFWRHRNDTVSRSNTLSETSEILPVEEDDHPPFSFRNCCLGSCLGTVLVPLLFLIVAGIVLRVKGSYDDDGPGGLFFFMSIPFGTSLGAVIGSIGVNVARWWKKRNKP